MTIRQLRTAGDEIERVAVAIRRMSPQGHTHSGVLYRHTNGQLFLLHLGGDCDLSCEVFDGSYAWVIPELLPEEADEIRAVCRAVRKEMPLLHYAFRFDPGAKLHPDTAELVSALAPFGLTCSTFVLAVFNSANVRLIDLTGWQHRSEDERWYGKVLRYMRGNGVDENHLSRIEKDVSSLRVRPEETAGACLEPVLPARFQQCEPNGRNLLTGIDARFDPSNNQYTAAHLRN